MRKFLTLLILLISMSAGAQRIMDSCFISTNYGFFFQPSPYLVGDDADLIEWQDSVWVGQGALANLTLTPPGNINNSRAIFIGGDNWTTNGEGFFIRVDKPFVKGETYFYEFTYVSHGNGSDGKFRPELYTNSEPVAGTAFQMNNLPQVDTMWTTNTISFTAFPAQEGHNWLFLHTGKGSSGIIYRFCETLGPPTGIAELDKTKNKRVVKILDLQGRETAIEPNKILIYEYSDGSRKRVLQIQN